MNTKDISKKDISKFINASIREAVKNAIISSEKKSQKREKIHLARPSRVLSYLVSKGFEDITDNSDCTNGWQWDYYMHFLKDGKVFCLEGDGFYKDYCEFSFDKYKTEEYLADNMDDALE